ncbi:MAG: 50S ribosomal protein L32 [Actinobacteria bacterium]|nr:50S ribosomal protein L32 [Actinomycetota bacterium]MBM3713364.1 50S ribosomal protein L32 [Actinomycetota bacterium]
MAAVPKNKKSKSKRDMKRNSFKLKVLSIVECPRCHSKKIAHRICNSCGYYDNVEIIKMKEKGKEKGKETAKTRLKGASIRKSGAETSSESKKKTAVK